VDTRPEIHFSAADRLSLPTKPNIDILIVESSPADTRLTCEAFKAAGVTSELRCVSDGADALMYVRRQGKYANATTPDLIFLDLSLPKVSGLEVLKEIKATPELRHIPIVVASGSEDPEDVRAVYALNGNCFMRKPQELTQFLRFVETCYQFWGHVVTLNPKLSADKPAGYRSRVAAASAGVEN
jgi:two-component system, chemotaxis family, response regulator Rcp1